MIDPIAPLLFGIPQLDELLGYNRHSDEDDAPPDNNVHGNVGLTSLFESLHSATSLAIVGEDGTGKSLIALHLAAAYAALHYRAVESGKAQGITSPPRIVYASSDYRFAAANTVWAKLFLDFPWQRYLPGIDEEERRFRTSQLNLLPKADRQPDPDKKHGQKVTLHPCKLGEIAKDLLKQNPPAKSQWCEYQVNFIDLAKESTGDDWRFITSLVAAFKKSNDEPPSLLVVDSVAGFETFIGKTNTFGEESSRRSRISQLLRAASDNWHVVFIAEEPDQIKHHPEEYVTDMVLHLHRTGTQEKVRRYLEIEKCRARNFAQGEHQFEIRDGMGTSTKSWENPDDMRVSLHPDISNCADWIEGRDTTMAYIQVFPSLHYLSKKFGGLHSILEPPAQRDDEIPKAFNIKYLDEMLRPRGSEQSEGLRPASVTALIGEEGTRKVYLAEEFLVAAYKDLPDVLDLFLEISLEYRLTYRYGIANGEQGHSGRAMPFKEFIKNWVAKADASGVLNKFVSGGEAARRMRKRVKDFVASEFDLVELDEIALGNFELREPGKDTAPLKPRWALKEPYLEAKETNDKLLPDAAPAEDRRRTPIPAGAIPGVLALAFSALRLPMGALAPTVFIATHDFSSESLAKRVIDRHLERLKIVLVERGLTESYAEDCLKKHLRRVLESWITVRRAELADCTAPQLWHVIEAAVLQGMTRLGYNASQLRSRSEPKDLTDQVRVIISDLRLLRETYPAIADDSLFLATVVFRLKRYGVTTIIVESDNGRLNQSPSHAMSGALRSLVDHQINTWKVNFFGEERVAITVLPSLGTSSVCRIRELRFAEPAEYTCPSEREQERPPLIVDPLFEMFENIEEGSPRAIPLRVQLYGETPAFEQYVRSEEDGFKLLFAPEMAADSGVLRIASTTGYQAFRDYIHLPTARRLPFSLVMMVDGFWALGRQNTLKNQHDYLFDELPGPNDSRFEDPFRLFVRDGNREEKPNCRADFFRLPAAGEPATYEHRMDSHFNGADRVPFMWDFGFLLCNLNQWKNAANCKLRSLRGRPANTSVGSIFEQMTRTTSPDLFEKCISNRSVFGDIGVVQKKPTLRRRASSGSNPVSWRDFLEACTLVANTEEKRTGKTCRPFDVAMTTPDLLGCLLFEIWFSEIYKDILRLRRFVGDLKCDQTYNAILEEIRSWINKAEDFLRPLMSDKYLFDRRAQSKLSDAISEWDWRSEIRSTPQEREFRANFGEREDERLLFDRYLLLKASNGYSIHLYQSWLLLLEAMDFRAFEACQWSFELACNRAPDPSAPAVRHWYKTACDATEKDADGGNTPCAGCQTRIPVQLPGHFTVRGDWFLATADGSRSGRLAAQAIDILSSRRANRTRLHLGLGLPVRDLTADREFERLRTGLTVRTPTGIYRPVCKDVLQLGGRFLWRVEDRNAGWWPGAESEGPNKLEMPKMLNTANGQSEFFWLLRSGIRDYDRQAVVISRWIQRLFEWTVQIRFEQAEVWEAGFKGYDELDIGEAKTCRGYKSWERFFGAIKVFSSDLAAATQGANGSGYAAHSADSGHTNTSAAR